jgi:alpha-1,2-mannosyltransferase
LQALYSFLVSSPNSLSMLDPARWLDCRRVVAGCRILLAIEIAAFVFFAAGTHELIVPLAKPTTTDFVSFYAAGALADSGGPQLAYDKVEHYAAEQRATRPGIDYNFFYYPPVFLLLCAGLARLPYLVAFGTFEAATLALFLLVARRILDQRGWQVLCPLLAFPPVLWTIGLGQNSFLTAALLGAAILLVDRRPIIAGLLFGTLCYKPHFGLLVPVAMVAGRHWRAFAAIFASAASLCLLSLVLFGWQTWHDFFVAAVASRDVYGFGRIPFGGFVTPFGAATLLGATPAAAGLVQAAASAAVAGFVAYVWRRNLPLPIRAASLVSATLVAVPLALFYDLVLAGVAGAWLLRADGKYRLPEWGKPVLAVLYVVCLNPRGIAIAWHVPVGSIVATALFTLVHWIAIAGRGADNNPRKPYPSIAGVDPGLPRRAGVDRTLLMAH